MCKSLPRPSVVLFSILCFGLHSPCLVAALVPGSTPQLQPPDSLPNNLGPNLCSRTRAAPPSLSPPAFTSVDRVASVVRLAIPASARTQLLFFPPQAQPSSNPASRPCTEREGIAKTNLHPNTPHTPSISLSPSVPGLLNHPVCTSPPLHANKSPRSLLHARVPPSVALPLHQPPSPHRHRDTPSINTTQLLLLLTVCFAYTLFCSPQQYLHSALHPQPHRPPFALPSPTTCPSPIRPSPHISHPQWVVE